MKKGTAGFTLIEMLVVVIVVGLLAAVAIPGYSKFVEKSRAVEALNLLGAMKTGEVGYKLAAGSFTNNLSLLDVTIPASTMWTFTATTYSSNQGVRINAVRRNGPNSGQNIQLQISPTGTLSWTGTHPGKPQ